ncbi:MAG: T9SS type A sorting domain-containing protein, partial [Bacteroidota bacterium]
NDQHYYATPQTLSQIFLDIEQDYEAAWIAHGIDKIAVFEFIDGVSIHNPYSKNCLAVRMNHLQGFQQITFEFIGKKTGEFMKVNAYDPMTDVSTTQVTDDPSITMTGLTERYYVFIFRKECGFSKSGMYIIIVDMDRILKGPEPIHSEATNLSLSFDTKHDQAIQLQTFPNPFIQQATIQFELSEESQVSVQIMDLAHSRPVAILMEQMQLQAGQHVLDVDLEDLPAGMYTCVVQIGDQLVVHRMVKLE